MKFHEAICLLALFAVHVSSLSLANNHVRNTRDYRFLDKTRITNGQNAVQGAYPYQVSLWWGFPPEIAHSHTCGGAIITNQWIVTAAHCFTNLPDYGSVIVQAGKYLIDGTEANQQSSTVNKMIIHPNYQGGENPDDVALLKLDSPFTFTKTVASIALPAQGATHIGNAVVTGWGSVSLTESILLPNVLQMATVPIINNTICYSALFSLVGENPLESTNICTGPLDNSRIAFCSGDSGGPLAQLTNGIWQLVGIVSWGVFPCGEAGMPSVYVRVSSYTNWITAQID